METECCSLASVEKGLLLENDGQKQLNSNSSKQESNSRTPKATLYKNSAHTVRKFEVLQSLRKDEVLCDIKLETDDGTIVCGHKIILASATPYFHTMFTNFEESKKEHVILRELDSTALKMLIDFIYTAQIMITEDNIQDLLYAANLLQLEDVKEACCDFLLSQLNPTNCLGFKALVSLYGFVELLSSFEFYIQQNFLEVVEGDEFLCLPYEQVVELISCNALNVQSEEKVFECVINWINHNSDCTRDVLFKLMEHVRLPLIPKEYLSDRVNGGSLLKNSWECNKYIIKALKFHLRKNEPSNVLQNTIYTKPRQPVGLQKILLVVGYRKCFYEKYVCTEWYDPVMKSWKLGPMITSPLLQPRFTVVNDRYLFFWNNHPSQTSNDVYAVDLSSPSPYLKQIGSMLKYRILPGVGVLDNCIYVVGGRNPNFVLKHGEVFNISTQKWQKISKMSTPRYALGVGVLNNHLYAVGGYDFTHHSLRSVERYCPKSNTWTPVKEMRVHRTHVGVGVLNGLMYVVGGHNRVNMLQSVEVYNPKSDVWTFVSPLNLYRRNPPSVLSLDGLLYVDGGDDETPVESYNPITNTWSKLPANNIRVSFGAVVINKPPCFNT